VHRHRDVLAIQHDALAQECMGPSLRSG
jgi:hypothetical protein